MRYLKIFALKFAIVVWLIPTLVLAQSYTGGLHFMRSPDLVIERQDIAMSVDKISVNYQLHNISNLDIVETLVFSLPMQNQFSVTVNNQPISYNIIQRAIAHNGIDISNMLKNLGLAYDPITAMHSIDASPNREIIRNKLISMDLIDAKDETPKWMVKIFYYWQQKFPARATVDIKQIYKPAVLIKSMKVKSVTELFSIPGKIVKKLFNIAINWTFEDNPEDSAAVANLKAQLEKHNPQIKDFCPSIKDYLTIVGQNKKFDPAARTVTTKELNYDYYSEDTWVTPINHFSLTIESPNNMHPVLCWNGDFKQASENKLLFEAENYVPLQKVSVLYIEK